MIVTTNEKGICILTPTPGMYLTNGETYSTKVYLGKNAKIEDWHEVSELPKEEYEEENTVEEKALAYDILMGVSK